MLFVQVPAEGTYLINVLPASLLAALGMALAYIPVTMSAMSGAKPEQAGLASGIVNTTYQVGSAIGLAVMVALAASARTETADPTALLNGFHNAFFGAAIVAFAGAGIALLALRDAKSSAQVAVG